MDECVHQDNYVKTAQRHSGGQRADRSLFTRTPLFHTDNTLNYSTHYLYTHFCQRHSRWIHKSLYVLIRLKLTDRNGAAEQKLSFEFTRGPQHIALIGETHFNIATTIWIYVENCVFSYVVGIGYRKLLSIGN